MNQQTSISPQQNTAPVAAANTAVPVYKPLDDVIKEPLQKLPIQRKLAVGAADDPLEYEADAMANKVMRLPEKNFIQRKCSHCEEEEKAQRKPLISFIQRKCNHCEEEENDGIAQRKPLVSFIQKKETNNNGGTASETISNQINTTKGSGSGMDHQTQSFMESRFGTSFQAVKIHTGDYASNLSQQLNAQAFTVGNDVYFNQNKYAPNTTEGKYLLAHELTHTIQQNGNNAIQRVANSEFSITGLDESRKKQKNFVFFDLNKPDNAAAPEHDLDADEKAKIKDFAALNINGLQLNGFASEEGVEASNNNLIDLRLKAVKNVLTNSPINYDASTINTQALLKTSENKFNYRHWRTVEMLPAGQNSSRVQSDKTTKDRGLEACDTESINNIVIPARNLAVENITTAIAALDHFMADKTANKPTGNALLFAFKSDAVATAKSVKEQLAADKIFLNDMLSILKCGTEQSADCGDTAEALTNPKGIILCHVFFRTNTTVPKRASTLVHESNHGTRSDLNDRAYKRERVIDIINTRQALDNAESFSLFVQAIVNGVNPEIGPKDPDTVASCGEHEQMVRSAVAWAERWNTYAVLGLQQTYGKEDATADMAPHINFYFGGSSKPILAGILDKYTQMMNFFDKGKVDILCVDKTDPLYNTWKVAKWEDRTVKISIEQLNRSFMNAEDRVKYIYGALATDNFQVPEEHRMAYPNVARAYKIFFWGVEG